MVLALEMICSQCVCPLKGRKLMALAHALLNQIAFSPLLLCSHSHASPTACLPMLVLWIYTVQHCFFISFLWGKSPIDGSFGCFSASGGKSGSDQLIVSLS